MAEADDVRSSQRFRVDDDWSSREEKAKQKALDRVFEKRELALRKARQALDQLSDPNDPDASVIGWLYFFAYNNLNAAVNEAVTQDWSADAEKLEDVVEEFEDTVSPWKMKKWSEEAQNIDRPPKPMRETMRRQGSKIHQLIQFAYSGTAAVTEAGSEEDTDEVNI